MKNAALSVLRRTGLVLAVLVSGSLASTGCSSTTHPTTQGEEVAVLDFSPSPILLKKGDAKTLKVTATMADGTKKDVTADVKWESDNPNTATVDPHGKVVGSGAGVTTVKATYKDATGTVKVTVAP